MGLLAKESESELPTCKFTPNTPELFKQMQQEAEGKSRLGKILVYRAPSVSVGKRTWQQGGLFWFGIILTKAKDEETKGRGDGLWVRWYPAMQKNTWRTNNIDDLVINSPRVVGYVDHLPNGDEAHDFADQMIALFKRTKESD